jgi:hypothetical protein
MYEKKKRKNTFDNESTNGFSLSLSQFPGRKN